MSHPFPYLLPAVAMMLGWGLRGFIGGGPFGAMIPGAMVMLSLCLTRPRPRRDVSLLAAFAAVGVGFGGEMTYGQTVGFIGNADTFWWGFLGLALKGAIWGALAGGTIALSLTPRPALVTGAAATVLAASFFGWKLVNEPKLIYFSNRYDRPREEIWAGFLFAAIALVGYLAWKGLRQPALRLAIAGFVGGWIGFGFGGAILGLGRIFAPASKLHWWKYMEFFFGFCFGLALAWALQKIEWPEEAEDQSPPVWLALASAAVLLPALLFSESKVPVRFGYTFGACIVLVALSRARWLAVPLAYGVTFCATALDLAEHTVKVFPSVDAILAMAVAAAAGLAFTWQAHRAALHPRRMLEWLTWSCVAIATMKFAISPNPLAGLADHVAIGFILMAAAVSWMARRSCA